VKQLSFIHIADIHLDAPFTSLADKELADIRRNELEDCLKSIMEKVLNQNINLLLISGDLFEYGSIRGSTILTVKNLFSELYKTEIIIMPGNHDPLRENSYYSTSHWGSNVHILENSQQVLYLDKLDTCIYNIGVKGNVTEDYPVILNKEIPKDCFNILLFHGTVDLPFGEENYNSITSEELSLLGMDYIALGHMHCYSYLQNGKTIMINPGSPEPLGFDEEGVHGFIQGKMTLSDSEQKSIETQFISSAVKHYHNLEIDISDCASDEEAIKKMRTDDKMKLSSSGLYSITLQGFIPKEYIPGIKNISDEFKSKCFFIKIKNQTSIQFDYEQYLEDPGIKGEFVRKLLDMREAEPSELRRKILYMAMQYGLQALENGRVD
jgi:DNA repair exonuclease SbcCD nuclease subunit